MIAPTCQEASGAVEQNDATTNDHKEDKGIPKEAGSTKQEERADKPKNVDTIVVEPDDLGTEKVVNFEYHDKSKDLPGLSLEHLSIDGTASLQNKKETDHNKDSKDCPGASHEDLPIYAAVPFQNKKEIGIGLSLESTEPSENLYVYEKEVETMSDHKKDSRDAPGSLHEDLSNDGAVYLQNHKETIF
ncbi:Uncharacterized protein TCM_014878 [Theobroma cacao]|uniref:Uncharacterized protein n=1 Tax=Theobroma cacao TaxID=3641 RepID=A0A061FZ63_THECC|nr:Uncharacterized protein TCM_014878 [Theobroma cacao]